MLTTKPYLASNLIATSKEYWDGYVSAITPGTKTFSFTNIVDGAGTAFAIDAANTNPLQFVYDAAGDTATCEVSVKDGALPTVTVGDLSTVPVCNNAARTLTVRVLTEYPTPEQPTGRIMMPDDSAHELTFVNYAATVDQTVLVADGVYTVVINAFVNNAGNEMAQTVRRFMVATEVDVEAASIVDAIEGWGYFSRDEGAPSTVPGPSPIAGDTGWVAEGTIAPTGGTVSAPITLPVTAGLFRSYRRTYSSLFGSDEDFLEPGRANHYVEGCFRIVSHSGSVKTVKDENGADLSLYVIGVGLEVWDGPYHAKLCVVQPAAGSEQFAFMTATSLAAGEERYRLTGLTVPNGSLQLVRLSFDPASDDVTLTRGSVASGASPAGPIAMTDTFALPRTSLASDNDTFLGSGIRFGVLSVANQAVTCEWEFVRYGFLDTAYATRIDEKNTLGFAYTQSADAAADYRSRDLLFGASLDVDPTPDVANTLTASLTGPGAIPVGAGIPYTLRFYSVDWDDAAGASSPAGFAKANFPACYQTTGVAVPGYAHLTTGALARGRRSSAGSFSVSATWDFALEQSRLARRLLVCAYADSPLFPAPAFIAGMPLSALIVDDAPGKADYRCAVRQFLPDFYVREHIADDGTSDTWSCLSPDLAMAVFLGPNDALVDDASPHGLRDADNNLLDPNPGIVETANASYPSGFALGEPHVSPTDMRPAPFNYSPDGGIHVSATGGGATEMILLDSGWSDFGQQCYYNRMWVRLSNRGIVPGPAAVQVFFLGSTLRTSFVLSSARVSGCQMIHSNKGRTLFAQSSFQRYNEDGTIQTALVNAVPALSGASTPGVSATKAQNFVLAEFVWHVIQADVPGDASESHGCRAACINLTNPAHPDPATDPDPWSRGVDVVPELAATDIWTITDSTNNIAVRNSNIVYGAATPPPDTPVNPKSIRVDKTGEPQDFRPFPNAFRTDTSSGNTMHGLLLDCSQFPAGESILRIDSRLRLKARAKGMTEIHPEVVNALPQRPVGVKRVTTLEAERYCYFLVDAGKIGELYGLASGGRLPRGESFERDVRLYFRVAPKAKPGSYKVVLSQTSRGRIVGSYTTTVVVPAPGAAKFVGDMRTGMVFDEKDFPAARDAIPYGARIDLPGVGFAIQEGFRFAPDKDVKIMTGKIKNELVQVPRGHVFPRAPKEVQALPGQLEGVLIGQVLDREGFGIAGETVIIRDAVKNIEIAEAVTDFSGRYVVSMPAKADMIKVGRPNRRIEATIAGSRRRVVMKKGLFGLGSTRDMCGALGPLVISERTPKKPKRPKQPEREKQPDLPKQPERPKRPARPDRPEKIRPRG